MSYLLRVILPNRPGSLGLVATAIGTTGADIVSVDIVDKYDNLVVDDIVVDIGPGQMPDEVLSAAHRLDGVSVESIRPFDGALATHRELQLLEAMSVDPAGAGQLMVDELPRIFRSGWAALVRNDGQVISRSASAPEIDRVEPWYQPMLAKILNPVTDLVPVDWTTLDTSLMAAPAGEEYAFVAGRPGGPDFRPSELSRLAHLVGISRSIWLRYAKGKDYDD
ncbi:ACT domain-containing protein [Cumulibacter manganitolerans]|uniref:amino acid-binding protein n=1 Tax=Cumulibacter manganitolerans TaxID=1884992 RepID=UPI0012962C3B|nr:amino acid-binding protein [Cumulibacter manganitolerans]